MPRYYFSLVDGKHSAIDKRGQEFNSLSEAHLHALRMFAKLIEFIPDQISPAYRIKITLATGEPVLTTAWNLDERLGGPVSCGETDGVFPCRLRIRHGARPCPPAPATPTPLRPTSARSVPARTCLATACACS